MSYQDQPLTGSNGDRSAVLDVGLVVVILNRANNLRKLREFLAQLIHASGECHASKPSNCVHSKKRIGGSHTTSQGQDRRNDELASELPELEFANQLVEAQAPSLASAQRTTKHLGNMHAVFRPRTADGRLRDLNRNSNHLVECRTRWKLVDQVATSIFVQQATYNERLARIPKDMIVRMFVPTAIIGLLVALAASPAVAQTPFYQGKQIKVLVGFPPGGGSDLYGRVIADGLARHVDGKPSVVVQNQPGAGSVIAMNNYANRIPRDGTTVLIGTGQLLVRLLLGLDGARAKVSDFQALVATPMGRITYASPQTGFKSSTDLLNPKEPLILGVPEVISTIDAVLGLTVLKANFRSITGYPGKADVRLALLRNEINLDSQATPIFEQSVRPTVKDGQAIPLFAQGFMDGDELTRDPAAPDVPSVGEAYRAIHGVDPSGPAWESYKAIARAIGNGGKILDDPFGRACGRAHGAQGRHRDDDPGPGISQDRRERA